MGASQLPLHYLLALKTPYSPLQLATRCSWETLNRAHQGLGRVVTLLFYLHAGFYLNFFVRAHVLAKRIRDWDVVLGLVATVAFTVVGTTALAWVRKRNYRLFYRVHVALASLLLPVLYFHVHHIRLYIWQTLAVYVLHFVTRVLSEKSVSATVALVPGTTDLLDIQVLLSGKTKLRKWEPGQHVYLALQSPGLLSRRVKTKNPFTIASLPLEDGKLRLIARVLDGNTASLAKKAGSGRSALVPLTIEGPYGLTTHSSSLLGYSRVLFVAGGVGATFVMPLYRSLLRDLSPSAGSRRRQNVKFVWVVREAEETRWAIPADEKAEAGEIRGIVERLDVYVTRGSGGAVVDEGDDSSEKAEAERLDDDAEGVEMQHLLPAGSGDAASSAPQDNKLAVKHGRPDIRDMVKQTFAGTAEKDKVAIFVCGPKGMARDVRDEVGRWIEKREVWFWSEGFGL